MMRLRIPNGVVNADTFRFFADSVEPYGPELGVIDVTTRQNIQLRGVQLQDADTIIDGLHARGYTSHNHVFVDACACSCRQVPECSDHLGFGHLHRSLPLREDLQLLGRSLSLWTDGQRPCSYRSAFQ